MFHRFAAAAALLAAAGPAHAAETTTYTYDAKGRLVSAVRSGSINSSVAATYQYDRADNRRRVIVTGSPNPPQP